MGMCGDDTPRSGGPLRSRRHAVRSRTGRAGRADRACTACTTSSQNGTFDAFEQAHSRVLEELHVEVLAGGRTVDEAREERFRRLFAAAGADDDRRARASHGGGVSRRVPRGQASGRRRARRARRAQAPRADRRSCPTTCWRSSRARCGSAASTRTSTRWSSPRRWASPNPIRAIFAHALAALDCEPRRTP